MRTNTKITRLRSKETALRFLITLTLLVSASFTQAYGQGPRRGVPNYNPGTVTTVSGTVTKVTQQSGPTVWAGTHLTLTTEAGVLDVHLGPASFISQQGFQFAEGDQIDVTGSKVNYQNAPVLIAREVKKGAKVLTLRDEQGYPKWSRGRRRP
jgi:hypothetical protein